MITSVIVGWEDGKEQELFSDKMYKGIRNDKRQRPSKIVTVVRDNTIVNEELDRLFMNTIENIVCMKS